METAYPTNVETRAAIRTKYLGPTDRRGARLSVSEYSIHGLRNRRLIVNWKSELTATANHHAAAQEWLDRFIPGSQVSGPGLGWDSFYMWTWCLSHDVGARTEWRQDSDC